MKSRAAAHRSPVHVTGKSLAEFAPAGANEMRFILGRNSFLPQNTAIAAASSEPGMVRSAAGTALLRDSGLSSFLKPKQPLRFEEEKQSSVCKLSRLPRKPRKQSPRDLRRRRRAAAMQSFSNRSPAKRVRFEAKLYFCSLSTRRAGACTPSRPKARTMAPVTSKYTSQ